MTDRMDLEKIIESIRQHDILYSSTKPFRKNLRESIWQEVADKNNIDVNVLKVKWKSLRDTYKKHIRAKSNDSKAASSLIHWHWSKYLDFLLPHIDPSNAGNVHCVENDDDDDGDNDDDDGDLNDNTNNNVKLEDHTNFASDNDPLESTQQPKLSKRRWKYSSKKNSSDSDQSECIEQPNCVKKRRKYPNAKYKTSEHIMANVNEFDGIELLFLGYAKTIKNMPMSSQISIKMKFAKIMMEEELKCLE